MDPRERDASTRASGEDPGADESRPRNVGLWAGLGCLGVIVMSCCLLSYWAQEYGIQWALSQSDEVRATMSRGLTAAALQGIAGTCADGSPSEDVAQWFHPDLPAEKRNLVCAMDPAVLEQLGSEEQMPTSTLTASGESELAERFKLNPDDCYRYQAETFGVVACFDRGPDAPKIPYRIIDVNDGAI